VYIIIDLLNEKNMSFSKSHSFERYKGKGLTGLANLGNTCFINSCLQILSHTYELNDFLNQESYKKKLNKKYDSALLLEWDNLRKMMWSENCIISPAKFLKTIQKLAQIKNQELFTGYSQNDLPEFLLFLMDCFHISLAREVNMTIEGSTKNETDKMAVQCFEMIRKMYKKEYSEIWNLFYGIHVSQIISLDAKKEVLSSSPEPYFMIDLSLPPDNKSPSLYECFDYYVAGEMLQGENAWLNETSGEKQEVQKKINYWSFPVILTIDLKRFSPVNPMNKNQVLVTFPLENLDLTKYVVGYKKEQYIYDLFGIVNHSGNTFGGHYTSYVKTADDKWFHFNDTNVSEIKNNDELISSRAYCLFYRKRKNV
jgi:ubiquitin carboxyl-terminal hydrolase 8